MKKSRFVKKALLAALSLASCVAVTACTPEREPEPLYKTPLTEVIVSAGEDRLAINFCREDLVHFRYAPAGEEFLPDGAVPEAIAKFDKDYAPVNGVIEEGENETVIRTAGLTVSVNRTTLAVTVSDASGRELFKSAAEAFSASGEAKKASFERDVLGEEHFFGLGNDVGDDFVTLDHRNSEYQLWLSDDNVHAIIPLWYSTSGYGIYLNNSNRGTVSFKKNYNVSLEGGEMNFYFLWGPSFTTILTNWSELAGRMNMPPLYALGLTYRGFGQWSEAQLEAALTAQLDAGIKIDIAGVEPGWQTATYPCTYEWNTKFTQDAEAFVARMHALGLRVNLWEHPYVSPSAEIYEDILPFSLTGTEIGTRAWEGKSGNYAFNGGIVPDLTIEAARTFYWSIQDDNLVSIGVDGFKIDETDSWGASNSLTLRFPSGISNNAYHNLLGTLTVNLMHEQYRDEYNQRTFMFSRGNYAGMQRYATSAYTDYYGFPQFVMSVISQAYSGTYYTPEIRDTSTVNDADYMRRAQLMFLTPFSMSNEWATESTVLDRSDAVIACYKKYNDLHYELIPYMYSLFWNQYNTGVGVTRSLVMEFQNDEKTYRINNEFMLGDALLVCPVNSTARMATSSIYLPAGASWIDYNTGYVYEGGQTIEYTTSCSVLPLFVRAGSILPMANYGKNTADRTDTTLTLDIYPSADRGVSFTLYEDDGISYGYQDGDYAETKITAEITKKGILCTLGKRSGNYAVADRDCVMQIHYRALPGTVKLDGKKFSAVSSLEEFNAATTPCYFYDGNAENDIDKIIYVRLRDDGKEHQVLADAGVESAQTKPGVQLEGTLYECEAKVNTQQGTKISSSVKASGKSIVGNIGGDDCNTLIMREINAPADGVYDVEIVYFNGSGSPRMLRVGANDSELIPISCPATKSWSASLSITVPFSLKKGANTITFTTEEGEGYGPDLDCVIVYDDAPVNITLKGTIYLPGDANRGGTLALEDYAGAVGGSAVAGIGAANGNVLTYTVSVPATGPYQLNLNYSNGSELPQKVVMTINGVPSEISLPGTNSTHLFAVLNQTVYLEAGENTISFSREADDSRYECEIGGTYVSCNNKLTPRDGYTQSGGYAVGANDHNGKASFTMKGIAVPEEGTYRVLVYAGSADTRTFRLKVNGEDTGKLYQVKTGHYHNFQPLELTLELKKGANQLTFWQAPTSEGDSDWLPNFDYIELPDAGTQVEIRIGAISIQ